MSDETETEPAVIKMTEVLAENQVQPTLDLDLIAKLPIPAYKTTAKIVNLNNKTSNRLTFTLTGVLPSFANAIRRTILSDIPVVGFVTTPNKDNKATIIKNTSRFNNEYLKQRLSCIPIYSINLKDEHGETITNMQLVDNYKIELHVVNNTDSILWVTSKDFKLVNKITGEPMDKTEKIADQLFPPFIPLNDSNHYIDFMCLRPRVSDALFGEELHLTCEFNITSASKNSCYNVTKTISYGNTVDLNKQTKKIADIKETSRIKKMSKVETDFVVKNFELLDGKRLYIPNSFDFVIETLGIYENAVLVQHACTILADMLTSLLEAMVQKDETIVTVKKNMANTIPNCWDIILHNEDYTLGTMLNDKLYHNFYNNADAEKNMLNYCGFKKEHPHNAFSTLRIGIIKDIHVEFIQFMFSQIITQIRDEFLLIARLVMKP